MLEEWLSAQRHDLGLTENTLTPAGTERMTLMTMNEVCVLPAGHRLLAKAELTPQDFSAENFIGLSSTDSYRSYRQLLDALFHEQGIERRMVLESHSAASMCAMVKEGVGVSIVNPLTALDYASNGVHVRPFSVEVPFTVSLIRPLHRLSSALVTAFVQHLQQQPDNLTARLASVIRQALASSVNVTWLASRDR